MLYSQLGIECFHVKFIACAINENAQHESLNLELIQCNMEIFITMQQTMYTTRLGSHTHEYNGIDYFMFDCISAF